VIFNKLYSRSSTKWAKLHLSATQVKTSRWIHMHSKELRVRYQSLKAIRARRAAASKLPSAPTAAARPSSPKTPSSIFGLSGPPPPSRDWRVVWQDVITAVCIQLDALSIQRKLKLIAMKAQGGAGSDVQEGDPEKLARFQAIFRGKKARRHEEHVKMLNSEGFAMEYYEHVVQIQRLARQYLARCSLYRELEASGKSSDQIDRLLISPSHKKYMEELNSTLQGAAPSSPGAGKRSPRQTMPARDLTAQNTRLTFGQIIEAEEEKPIPSYHPPPSGGGAGSKHFDRVGSATGEPAVPGTFKRVLSVPSKSPWRNRSFAMHKMEEIRQKHQVFYVTRGGTAAAPIEEEEEEEEDAREAQQTSLDHHPQHGTVRSIIKENDKRALRLARKREKKGE